MFMLKVINESECTREPQMQISCNSPQLMTADLDDVPGRWCSHLRGCCPGQTPTSCFTI